jgi:O-antigen/teichoic acid export membrane protein
MSFGILNFITILGDTLRFNIDSAIIGRFLSMEAVGIYGVAFILIRLLVRISNACTVVTFPRLSQLAARDIEEFRGNYLTYARMSAILIWGLALELILLSPGFIRLWVGDAFHEAASVTFILTAALATDYGTTVSINALKALNRLHFYAAQTVAEGVLKLILSLYLVRDFGLIGVAMGTAIPLMLNKIVIQPLYTSRIIGVDFRSYFREVILLPPAIAATVGAAMYYAGIVTSPSYFFLSLSGFAVAVVYAAAVVLFYLRRDERVQLRSAARKFACYFVPGKKPEMGKEEVL